MTRLFKKKLERKKGIWKRVVDLALTDVRVAAGGIDNDSLESLEERLIAADFGGRLWISADSGATWTGRENNRSSTARKKPSVEGRHVAPRA